MADNDKRRTLLPRLFTLISCVAIAAGITVYVLTRMHVLPGSEVLVGSDLRPPVIQFLRDHRLLDEGEEVRQFYCNAFFSFEADGNFFTDSRVVSYWQDRGDKDLSFEMSKLSDVKRIGAQFARSYGEVSTVSIETDKGRIWELWVGSAGNKDREFVEALRTQWNLVRGDKP